MKTAAGKMKVKVSRPGISGVSNDRILGMINGIRKVGVISIDRVIPTLSPLTCRICSLGLNAVELSQAV